MDLHARQLEALKPQAVVAGHKVPENDDDPRIIAETRQYLRDFDRLDAATTTARELYDAMLESIPIASTRARSGARQTPPRNKLRAVFDRATTIGCRR